MDTFHTLNHGPDFPALSGTKRAELAEYYRSDVRVPSELLERDVTGWWW